MEDITYGKNDIMIINDIHVYSKQIKDMDELTEYVKRGKEKYGSKLYAVYVDVDENDNNYVYVNYEVCEPFERLARITGYLVGTLDRWNDSKRAEQRDRVKHGV